MHYIKGKGVFEASGKHVCSKRELDLRLARIHGHNGDLDSFTRLIIESRVAATHLKTVASGERSHFMNNEPTATQTEPQQTPQAFISWNDPQFWSGISVATCEGCRQRHVLRKGLCWACEAAK